MRSLVSNTLLVALIGLASFASAVGAQTTDVLRGRVTGPDTTSLKDVTVRATSYQGAVSKTATTDKSGRFTIVFLNGEGDYWLDFTKIGFAPKRFEVRRIGDEEVLLADARMSEAVQTLSTVQVTSQPNRALPNRNASGVDVGGGERPLTNNNVAADQAGNLAAMAAAIAGFQLIPGLDGAADMYTLLGLTGDQNSTTFNGLGSAISALPPDILATTSILPYSFDPANGGFSGAQIMIRTIPGSNFSRRGVANVNITPPLEWADATAASQQQKYTNVRFGGNALGPIVMNKAFYNVAYNAGRRFNDAQTLLNTGPAGLAAAGVAADSVARLLSILGNKGIPASAGGVPSIQAQDVAQVSTNFDLTPSTSGAGHSFTLGALGNYQRTQPVSGRNGLLLTTPAHGGQAQFWAGNVSLVHSNYFWFGVLSKTTFGLAASANSSDPYVQLPEGNVRVSSTLPSGNSSIKPLLFGGNSALSSLHNQTLQLNNQLSWYSADNHHTLKLTSSLAHDDFSTDVTPSLLGSFSYNSLADLATGTPSSYRRTLSRNTQSGSQLIGAASFGDHWRPSPGLQLQYGVRVDANHFMSAPGFNQALFDALGVRNELVPNRTYLSPRVGLQWYYGSSPQVSYAPGSARPPRAVIHAGVGVFQNMASSQLIGPAVSATGLPNSTQTITCVGSAVPFPDWNAFLTDPGTIPARCADGTTGIFATSAPNVSLFDARFRQPQSIRAAADWSSALLDNRFVLGLQAIASFGGAQSGLVDINLNPTPRFVLANEQDRPVFADPRAIVAGTGVVSTVDSRVSPAFQQVWAHRSDLRVESRQLTVNLEAVTANQYLKWDLTYNLLDARETYYGFTSTAGNPFERDRGRSLQSARHAVGVQWTDFPIFDVVYVSAGVRLSSGQRYTPMIAGDVNGDGSANDRALVFDPSSIADSATAAAMRSLLTNGTPSARFCLERQLHSLAARTDSPWVADAGMQIKFNPQKIGLPKRAAITLFIQNPLGLADLAVHGSDAIHGWGQTIPPDQNLLFVRGFDPVSRQFKYDVNQRFGSTRPQQSTTHALPFISLAVKVDIGSPRQRQVLTQRLDLGRGRAGTKQSPDGMKMLAISSIPNPMGMVLDQADSLHLTRNQADSLASLSHKFSVYADSIWTPVSRRLAALPDDYSHGEAYDLYVVARERVVDYLLTLVRDAKGVLTGSQRRKLPMQVLNYLDERVLKFLRSSSAGDNSSVIAP